MVAACQVTAEALERRQLLSIARPPVPPRPGSPVPVGVALMLASIKVSPVTSTVADSASVALAATGYDQFGNPLATQPAVTWSVANGGVGGTVNSAGQYTAPVSGVGLDTVVASSGSVAGSATENVTTDGIFSADNNIGSPNQLGSFYFANGTYVVTGNGAGIGGGADQFNFVNEPFPGDSTISARVASVVGANGEAGVMLRDATTPNGAFAGVFIAGNNNLNFVTRAIDNGSTAQTTLAGVHAPEYVELSSSGNAVSAFYSSDGINWVQVGSTQTIALGTNAVIGLAATAGNNSATATATYTNVSVLPAGWTDVDIGAPALPGWAGYDAANNTFALAGSGSDIGGTSDQFNFASRSMTGGGSVIALVESQSGTDQSEKAGVMIRNDDTAGSLFASVAVTSQNGLVFEWRSTAGAAASSTVVPNVTGPVWLEVTEQGSSFSAFYSSDGINWTQIGGTQTIIMTSATTLAGVVVTSHNTSAVNIAQFADVSVVQGNWIDNDLGAPADGGSAVYDAPSDTYTIAGTGSDIGGTSDQFNFASTPMNGNGSVIAYLGSISTSDASAEAGLMIRAGDTANAPFVGVFVTPAGNLVFEYRTAAGGTTRSVFGRQVAVPVSLELTRSGSKITAEYSTDGINWLTLATTSSVVMPAGVLGGMAITSMDNGTLSTATFTGVSVGNDPPPGSGVYSASDELFLNDLEYRSVQFYWDETNPNTGLTPDGSGANGGSDSSDSSIASVGFDLTALTIGDARGWITHANAYQRALTTINFLYNDGANNNGFFYHFLNITTGARYGTSEVSDLDTAELMAGVLTVAQYWAGTPLQTAALQLFDRVNWPWMQKSNGQFYGQWTPESGFQGNWGDFSEATLLYLEALGSPTHPIAASSWDSWSRTPVVNYDGYTFVTADDAALFTEQYPQAWFDLRGMEDNTSFNFYQNSQTATLAQRQMFINISSTFSDYGPNFWGLTPSEGPNGYTVWGGPPATGPIDGTVAPTAAGGSLEFEPRLAIDDLENMKSTYGSKVYQKYGFVDAFNPLTNWTASNVLGIDVGMMLISAENSRTGSLWSIFMQTSDAQTAIAQAGFHSV